MKKICLSIICLLFVFSFNHIKAVCNDEDLNEFATKIEANFIESTSVNAESTGYAYFLSVTPLRDDIKIKVIDNKDNSAWGQNYEYSFYQADKNNNLEKITKSLYGVGCYNNLEEETYKIEVYGADNSKCKNELLKTINYTVPRYNRMVKYAFCEKYPEHELCKIYTDKTKTMTEKQFKETMEKYDEEETEKIKNQLTLVERLLIYSLYVIVPFVIATIIYMIKVKNYKKFEGAQ